MPKRSPEQTNAYLVGGGIASLTAAIHLYYDAGVPAHQIHIFEAARAPGGSMGQSGGCEHADWRRGYVIVAARKLNFSYACVYDTLSKVPSTRHPGRTVLDDVRGVDDSLDREEHGKVAKDAHSPDGKAKYPSRADTPPHTPPKTEPYWPMRHKLPARLVATGIAGPEVVDVQSMGLQSEERMGILRLIMDSEEEVGDGEIQAHFQPTFFESKFWDAWASLYGFQPWHSAIEFRRYLLRFLHEFSHISTLEGIDHAPLNDYECIIQPIEHHLRALGVDIQYKTQVTDVEFAPGSQIHVNSLQISKRGDTPTSERTTSSIQVTESDIVLITLGSMMTALSFGSNDEAPAPLPSQDAILRDPGPVWRFWKTLVDENPQHSDLFGRPQTFYGHMGKSSWLTFTITLSGAAASLFSYLKTWAGYEGNDEASCLSSIDETRSKPTTATHPTPNTTNTNGPLITFRDSPWMMSISMPCQPYFVGQPDGVCVLWGYGLYPDQEGMFVRKPMMACSGAEIFSELLAHLNLPSSLYPSDGVTTIPCLMPFIGSPFLPRTEGDRPSVIPPQSDNLGFVGQFVEMERDVTFTMEYSARSAQTAVFALMGLDKKPPAVHRGDRDVQVLGQMMMTIMS